MRPYFVDPETPSAAFFIGVTTPVIDTLLKDKAFQPSLEFHRWEQALDILDFLKAGTTELLARVGDLTRKLDEMSDAIAARQAGVSEKALFRLVAPIAENIEDRDEALLALHEAVQVAKRVQEEGQHGSNLGDFVDEVLRRVTALSADGQYETAIDEIDDALEREEAESTARKIRLLNSGVDQHLLAFDADGAAAKIARRVALETPDPGALFGALRAERRVWYERGRDKGLNLDLRVAIALAEITRDRAADADQRGTARNDLGIALWTLGERESGTDRLEDAVAAFRAALEEWTRDRVPLDWAGIQMNLGTALATIGQRERGTSRLEDAVAAFGAALEEWTRDRVPLQWAMVQGNLCSLHLAVFDKTGDPARLDAAQATLDAARAVFAAAQASHYLAWADDGQAEIDTRRGG